MTTKDIAVVGSLAALFFWIYILVPLAFFHS